MATAANLTTNAACYTNACTDKDAQKALLIYAKVLELAAAGGTNYAAQLTGTLLVNAAALPVGKSEDAIMAARINLAFVKAANAGASVPATVNLKLAAVSCLSCVDPELLDLALLLLESDLTDTTYS